MSEMYTKLLSLHNSPEPEAQLLYNELLMELLPRQRKYFLSNVLGRPTKVNKTSNKAEYMRQYRQRLKAVQTEANARLSLLYKQEKENHKVEPNIYAVDMTICNMQGSMLGQLSEVKRIVAAESSLEGVITPADIDNIYVTTEQLLHDYSCIIDIFRNGDSTLDSESFEYIRECYQKNKELRVSIQDTMALMKKKIFNKYKTSVIEYNPVEVIKPLILLYNLKSVLQAAKTLTYKEGYLYTKLHRHSQWARSIKQEINKQYKDRQKSFEELDKLLTTTGMSSEEYWSSLEKELTESEGYIEDIDGLRKINEVRTGNKIIRQKS